MGGFSFDLNVSAITVFVQGLLSFLSPCVLPLVPLYLGYLAGGNNLKGEESQASSRKRIFINSIFFVIGISFTFFLLGFGFTALGKFFSGNRLIFARVSGIIMIFFGLYQLGLFGKSFLIEKEHKFSFSINKWTMGPVTAFLLGFTFSFAWTPCVGPILGSVVLFAGTSADYVKSASLIGIYALGFGIPFLLVGLFTSVILEWIKKYKSVLKYTVKTAAVLMIFMGFITFTGNMNDITSYLTPNAGGVKNEETIAQDESTDDESDSEDEKVKAPEIILKDQFGNVHNIADYKGKTVFLNFWATWCPPCKEEMPDIQKLYEEYGGNKEDLVVLGIAGPKMGREGSVSHITSFLKDNGYTFPVLMDESGTIFSQFNIYSFPTTYMIDKDGNIFGYVSGGMSKDIMENIVKQTMEGKRN